MDFIKKLIGGIFGFLLGLLPKKKSNGFYLELDEAASGTLPKAEAKPAAKPAASNGKKAEAVAAPIDSPAPAAVATITPPAPTNGKAPKAEPVKAEPATPKAAPTETTFAPKYVAVPLGSSNGRRLPGANMNGFLDLARQVKTPG